MAIYAPDQEIHAGEDVPCEALWDSCSDDDEPVLTGKTFLLTATPTEGIGTLFTRVVTVVGTDELTWSFAAANTTGFVGERFRVQIRRTNASNARVWLQWDLVVVP